MTKTITTSGKSPLNQRDVTAIETAFSTYTNLLAEADGEMTLPAMLTHDKLGDLITKDFPAFQFVVAKHGYVATKEGSGVRITQGQNPDPTWVNAHLD